MAKNFVQKLSLIMSVNFGSMKGLFTLLVALSFCVSTLAQKKLSVTVKAGDNIMNVLPHSEIFLYPSFTTGKVFLKNGTEAETKLNYNRVVDEIHFIDPKGDTLALDDEKSVKYIVINNDSFFYDQGYIRVFSSGNLIKLGIRQRWMMVDTRQFGGYNSSNNSERLSSFASMRHGGRLYDLTVSQDMTLETVESYYFGDLYNNFVIAGKANLLALFPKGQVPIKKYLKENKVNFGNRDDLDKLLQFLNRAEF